MESSSYTVEYRLYRDTDTIRCLIVQAMDAQEARCKADAYLRSRFSNYATTRRVAKGNHWVIYPEREYLR